MKFIYIVTLMMLFIAIGTVFPNGLSLNSIGPKGLGMGGAFVGLANDYTAIYWNPAGLTQMQKNFIGVFGTDVIPLGSYKFYKQLPAPYPTIDINTETKTNHYISPNLMGYYHCTLVENLIFGLGVYVPAGLGTEWEGEDLKMLSGGTALKWKSKIGVINFSPAVAYKFSEQFSAGVAMNIFYGMFDMDNPAQIGTNWLQYTESSTGLGYGVTIGALAELHDMLSIGASFRTKTSVTMSGTAKNGTMESDFDRDVAWPMWISGGAAFRPMDNLVITADAQFSQWSESEDKFITEYKAAGWGKDTITLDWEDAVQIRFGVGYKIDESLDLRAGFYIDPAPAPEKTYNILFSSISYNAVSIGAGYKFDSFVIDLGLEYLLGKDREIVAVDPADERMPGTHGMDILAFSFGVGYEFE
ncbi:MAG: outer membrane protein transport protein [Ignavibacteriales bacterium]|nr:outer membrane protein transport protein [Ignavibacteriales bacterium]